MRVIIIYKDGKSEEREGFKQLEKFDDKIYLRYVNREESGVLEIPKSAVKRVVITDL